MDKNFKVAQVTFMKIYKVLTNNTHSEKVLKIVN